jgi:hypothetical protein
MKLIAILLFTAFLSVYGIDRANKPGPAGIWKGESICTIKTSPCHDEKVVYRITEPDSAGKLTVQMDKIVNGAPENMAKLDCNFSASGRTLTCPMRNGEWKFIVDQNSMNGTLSLPDGTLYRKISVQKQKN